MNDLLGRLEAMGPVGGVVALGVGGLCVAAAVAMLWLAATGPHGLQLPYPFVVENGVLTSASVQFLVAAAFGAIVLGMPAGFLGAHMLRGNRYPSASEVFPTMTVEQITTALAEATETQIVCTKCRVMVPAAFSTGSCPVCASTMEYHPVESDEDLRMVIAAMS